MGSLVILLSVIVIAGVTKDIVTYLYPSRKDVEDLKVHINKLEDTINSMDVKKLEALRSDVQALKLQIPIPRRK